MASLKIYKASAGSGKTFNVVREYLRIVFQRPGAYKNILAVTFTNKATAEMKDRILKDLSLLAQGKKSDHRAYLKEEFGYSDDQIQAIGSKILTLILHDYSRFSVSTIDSFFQRVIRAFSREMRLNSSYRTELDNKKILEEAIDRLFLDIDVNVALRNWMLNYAEDMLKSGKDWNFKKELTSKGQELFNEEFKLVSGTLLDKLADKNFLTSYKKSLNEIIDAYKQQLSSLGNAALALLREHGLSANQFKYAGLSFANHFTKIANGSMEQPGSRALQACDNLNEWYKSDIDPALISRIQAIYAIGLNRLLKDSLLLISTDGIVANTAQVILDDLFSFGLLTDIALKVQEVSKEKNVVLLTDSTQLLRNIITQSDTPFVYEKMGSAYRHFMLDEFQDTSRIQWSNFKPLIENSLSEGHLNVIVGDVKQSIYRWRNGDWNLLATQIQQDLSPFPISTVTLGTNWRSAKKIIDFNNALFRETSRLMNGNFESMVTESGHKPEDLPMMTGVISKAYEDHFQKYSGNIDSEGYVRIEFVEKPKKADPNNTVVIRKLIVELERVQRTGVPPSDIAILVRNKKEGTSIANALLEHKTRNPESPFCFDVISNDTLQIGTSPSVCFLINFLTLFASGDNDILKADLLYGYYNLLSPLISSECVPVSMDKFHSLVSKDREIPELFKSWFKADDQGIYGAKYLTLPLFELTTLLAKSFNLHKISGELAYLDAFFDLVLQYSRDEGGSLAGFLDWWESFGSQKTVVLEEGQNAISILTIHKSKGLEYHTVFVPFVNWSTLPYARYGESPGLWCQPEHAPFDALDVVFLRYGGTLPYTQFSLAYFKEMLYCNVDSLNLLYVACTRAIHSLIAFCPYTEEIKKTNGNIATFIQLAVEKPPLMDSSDRLSYIDLHASWNPETRIIELGSLEYIPFGKSVNRATHRVVQSHLFTEKNTRLKLKIHSDSYVKLRDVHQSDRVEHGKLMHELFEHITSKNDVSPSLKKAVSEGRINQSIAHEYEDIIFNLFEKEPFRSWFSGQWMVLNERPILRGKEQQHRPDRVMIKAGELIVVDYKTGDRSEKHQVQVKGYLNDFIQMGYKKPKGFLWYLSSNELVEVV
jgi:ATP-dependent helicase/nuclease subunit A